MLELGCGSARVVSGLPAARMLPWLFCGYATKNGSEQFEVRLVLAVQVIT